MFCSSGVRRLFLLVLLVFVPLWARAQGTYTTNFPLTENPISEGGKMDQRRHYRS